MVANTKPMRPSKNRTLNSVLLYKGLIKCPFKQVAINNSMKTTIPFTYLIGWTSHNLWYYGVRFAEGCSPSDLWTVYFTSSKKVEQARLELGEPDVIKVRKIFQTDISAKLWEDRVLASIPKHKREFWLNQTFSSFRGMVFTDEIRRKIGITSTGRECRIETREKISESMTGIIRSDNTKQKVSIARKKVIATKGNAGLASMHTEEVKAKVAEKNRIRNIENPPNKGRIWISKDGDKKMIRPDDYVTYELAGWKKGYKG